MTTRLEESKDTSHTYYQPILAGSRKLLQDHPTPESVTFCWMQGERDAREKLSAAYSGALKQFIDTLRRDLGQPQMNLVIGRLSDFGKTDDLHWQKIREAQVSFASADLHAGWVDCDDLNDRQKDGMTRNDLHYTQQG